MKQRSYNSREERLSALALVKAKLKLISEFEKMGFDLSKEAKRQKGELLNERSRLEAETAEPVNRPGKGSYLAIALALTLGLQAYSPGPVNGPTQSGGTGTRWHLVDQ